ncbi:MAG: family 20 glycosylhydrolase, partial [Armatimonadota bacterium]|nr:family 20 glycosylhydrolase [Armatimonadota bacterium]
PMDSTRWRRISAPVGAFWNRDRVPMDTRRIVRLYIGTSGTHHFEVDQIALEAKQRPVAARPLHAVSPPMTVDAVQFADGRYALRFDPSALMPGPLTATADFDLARSQHRATQKLPGATPQDEVLLAAPAVEAAGDGSVRLTLVRQGETVASGAWDFDLVASRPLPDPTELSLLPAPKEIELGEGAFPLLPGPSPDCTTDAMNSPALRLLTETLAAWGARGEDLHGIPRAAGEPLLLRIGAPEPLDAAAAERLRDLPAQGYVLVTSGAGVAVAANDLGGLRNGVCTLLQAAESHYARTGVLAAPAMHVVDWPSLPIRAVSMPLPTNRWGHPNDPPVDPDFFIDYLRRVVVAHKLNMCVLIIHQAMQYDSHPIVAGPAAWPKSEVKRVFDALRSWGVEPVPLMNSLGHANWLTIPYRDLELAEDGDVHQLCTSHPRAEEILTEIYQEIIDLVEPAYFHVGLDEIRWKTHTLPEEQRCPRCAGKSKQDIFAEWVQMLHDFLAEQDIEMMMWGDMILPGHNGGPPYNLAETVGRLPKDVIICNWSTGVTPESHAWLREHGYQRIIKSNSRGATPAEQELVMGNMMGVWYKTHWLTEHTAPKLEGNAYGSILAGAEYSWNHWPDLFSPMPPLRADFFGQRPLAQWRIAGTPAPAGLLQAIELPEGDAVEGLPSGSLRFGAIPFTVAPERAIELQPGERATVEVNRAANALYILHAARLLDREAMVEAFKAAENWGGAPVAEYTVAFESGQTEMIPVRYGMDARDPEEGWCVAPLCYTSLGAYPMTCEADGLHLFARQWRNPRPDDEIVSVTIRQLDAPARVVLAGLAAE